MNRRKKAPTPARPTATPVPKPVATPKPAATPKSTAIPKPTATPKPVVTSNPVIPKPVVTPAPKPPTPSEKVRREWKPFELWLAARRQEVDKRVEKLLSTAAAQGNKGGPHRGQESTTIPDRMMSVITRIQAELVLNARQEWEARLEKAGLQAEDWTDMTAAEMQAVEQALAPEGFEEWLENGGMDATDTDTDTLASAGSASPYTAAHARWDGPSQNSSSGSSSSRKENLTATNGATGRSGSHNPFTHRAAPAAPILQDPNILSPRDSLAGRTGVVLEKNSAWGAKRTTTAAPPKERPQSPIANGAGRKPPAFESIVDDRDFIVRYASPIAIEAEGAAQIDAEYEAFRDTVFSTSIKQFHAKAAEADVELLRKLSSASLDNHGRAVLIKAHEKNMEDYARDLLERRKTFLNEEMTRRLGKLHGQGTPSNVQSPQPPSTFPESANGTAEIKNVGEEAAEVATKGAAKKKGKKKAETKPTNGRPSQSVQNGKSDLSNGNEKSSQPNGTSNGVTDSRNTVTESPSSPWEAFLASKGQNAGAVDAVKASTNGHQTLTPAQSPWNIAGNAPAAQPAADVWARSSPLAAAHSAQPTAESSIGMQHTFSWSPDSDDEDQVVGGWSQQGRRVTFAQESSAGSGQEDLESFFGSLTAGLSNGTASASRVASPFEAGRACGGIEGYAAYETTAGARPGGRGYGGFERWTGAAHVRDEDDDLHEAEKLFQIASRNLEKASALDPRSNAMSFDDAMAMYVKAKQNLDRHQGGAH